MAWLERVWSTLITFLSPPLLLGLSITSVVTCVVSLIVASWAVQRLPEDYLLHDADRAWKPGRQSVGLIARNLAGGVLVALGILMLLLPGQGVLTILAGLALMDFRGKRRLEHWLMLRPTVFAAINRLRARAGRPRLASPVACSGDGG